MTTGFHLHPMALSIVFAFLINNGAFSLRTPVQLSRPFCGNKGHIVSLRTISKITNGKSILGQDPKSASSSLGMVAAPIDSPFLNDTFGDMPPKTRMKTLSKSDRPSRRMHSLSSLLKRHRRKLSALSSDYKPILSEICALGIPALGGMIVDPVMGLVDTAFIGQTSPVQLAALAPCTSIYSFLFAFTTFLSAATTNMIASNSPDAATSEDDLNTRIKSCERVQSSASMLALGLGSMMTILLLTFSDTLLRIACPTISLESLIHARKYLQIRAIAVPFLLLATVLQGASVGRGDASTPLKIFVSAGLVNLIGDWYLTLSKGMGMAGAAWATSVAQIGATMYYCWIALKAKRKIKTNDDDVYEGSPQRLVRLRWHGLPDRNMINRFASVAAALLSRSIVSLIGYISATCTAGLCGTVPGAAHQVAISVFWVASFLPEPMSTAAQALVARDLGGPLPSEKEVDSGNAHQFSPNRIRMLSRSLYGISFFMSLSMALVTGLALTNSASLRALSSDPLVRSTIKTIAPYAMINQVFCAMSSLSEGICVGAGRVRHLPTLMVASTLLIRLALKVVLKQELGLIGVWQSLTLFFASRVLGHIIFSKSIQRMLKMGKDGRISSDVNFEINNKIGDNKIEVRDLLNDGIELEEVIEKERVFIYAGTN